ncbi:hypothetical protein BDW22DRAFT_247191 [Trametopsis cervina]|nr:hypothetical protein BDW22DRAFT_247191 [Trametopsis cervina]
MTPRRPGRRLGRRLCRTKRSSRQSPATPSDTEDARLGTQANPAHVLNRDMPRGWTVIQKAVDEFDKDQIEGVKNDIDTLLVFNGLFSAVLSAFFVLAITLLQEDIPGATLTTLRHMSAQNANYTIQGDFIHSTSPAPTSFAQFEPTVNAICINDMWTASLTISLITASFSILVKQWLREYMKFVTSFPQGRLRIRNFRRAGLETWKVLTIAACLPLLLQLALGLFFIGLCFYTTELHSSVRNTTLPLVIGWGFIIFFVTVSPLFSAHCPYKTPALDSLVVAIRASVRARWIKGMEALKSRATRVCRNATTYRTLKIARIVRIQADKYITRLKDPKRPHSEATAATHAVDDLDIMVAADALQGNDDILGTAMVDALQQITAPPQGIIGFVLNILQHRVQWDGDFTSEPQIIDCSMATTRALDSIHSILEQRLPIDSISMPSDTELLPVAHWTVCLYLSLGTNRGFHKVPPSLGEYLDKRPGVFVDVAIAAPSSLGLKSLLHLTCQSCKESELDLAQSSARIKSVVKHSFQKLELGDAFELDGHDALWRRVLNEDSLRDTFEFLTDLLRDDTAVQDGEWSGAQQDALFLIIKLIAVDPWHSRDIISALRRMILLAKSDAVVVRLQMLLIKSYPNLFYLYVLHEDFRTNTAALSRHMTAIETIATDSPNQLTRLSVLKACESLALSLRHVSDDDKCCASLRRWNR